MGRELRLVSKSWQHPMEDGLYIPMFDFDVDSVWRQWLRCYVKWVNYELSDVIANEPENNYSQSSPYEAFCDYSRIPPNPKNYRPNWSLEERTCFQIYETTSDGTPISPVFETREAASQWLQENGFRGVHKDLPSKEEADKFCGVASDDT